jgi:hypothetical protein
MRTHMISHLMARAALALGCALFAGCAHHGGGDERPRSAGEHLRLAERCESEAAVHDRVAREVSATDEIYVCDGGTFSSQTRSGGEPLTHWTPCWSYDQVRSAGHRRRAEELRAEARRHRRIARELVDVERTLCAPLSEDELARTPFFHRDDVATAVPLRDGDRIVGAEVTFRPVRGLDARWMAVAVACHRARAAALGFPPTFLSYDPTVLPHARAAAAERDGRVVVTIRAAAEVEAAVVWSRAAALCGPMPAADD